MAAMARLNRIWQCSIISFASKFEHTFPTWSRRPATGFKARSASLWVHRNLLWQLFKDGHLHGLDMSYATTASPKPFLRASWRVGDAMVTRGNARWTVSESGHLCTCQSCSQRPFAEKTGRESLLTDLLCPPNSPLCQGTELN